MRIGLKLGLILIISYSLQSGARIWVYDVAAREKLLTFSHKEIIEMLPKSYYRLARIICILLIAFGAWVTCACDNDPQANSRQIIEMVEKNPIKNNPVFECAPNCNYGK